MQVFWQYMWSRFALVSLLMLPHSSVQRFPLGGDDEVMSSTLQQFAKVIDEVRPELQPLPLQMCFDVLLTCLFSLSLFFPPQLSSCHAVLSTQLADAMMFPITQFKERDLKGEGAYLELKSTSWSFR